MYVSLDYLKANRALGCIVSEWGDLGEMKGLSYQKVKSIVKGRVIHKLLDSKGSGEPPDVASSMEQGI